MTTSDAPRFNYIPPSEGSQPTETFYSRPSVISKVTALRTSGQAILNLAYQVEDNLSAYRTHIAQVDFLNRIGTEVTTWEALVSRINELVKELPFSYHNQCLTYREGWSYNKVDLTFIGTDIQDMIADLRQVCSAKAKSALESYRENQEAVKDHITNLQDV